MNAADSLLRLLWLRLKQEGGPDLQRSAWVVAPHQDDEVLGCGGLILRKRALGSRVRVVFASDGSASHADLVPREAMRATRRAEAALAARRLGLAPEDLFFLDLPDGELEAHVAEGTVALGRLLALDPTAEVYIPYAGEITPDHLATHRLAGDALASARLRGPVFEYPIWFWHQWPWIASASASGEPLSRRLRVAAGALRRALRDLRHGLRVDAVLDAKREALAAYRSQLERPGGAAAWPTLYDVAEGRLLAYLFRRYELFCRSDRSARRRTGGDAPRPA